MTIGERIQELRKKKGMSQEELAEYIEVSKQSVSKWELDKALPNIEKILRLCGLFEITTDYLLKGERGTEDILNLQLTDAKIEETATEENSKEESIITMENGLAKEDMVSAKRCLIPIFICGVLTFVTFIWVLNIFVFHNLAIGKNDRMDYAYVDSIYEQYTKADIVFFNEDNTFVTKTVFLDLKGVNEGDWIICHIDENGGFHIKYRNKTLFTIGSLFLLCVGMTTIFAVRYRKVRRRIGAKEDERKEQI